MTEQMLETYELGDLVLYFGEQRSSGQVVAALGNRSTGEVREQLVDPARFVAKRQTVLARMERLDPDWQTPVVLLERG